MNILQNHVGRMLIAVVLCLASKVSNADDPIRDLSGYGNTRWGMTLEEVLTSEAPRAHKMPTPDSYGTLDGLIKIEELSIASGMFDAVFLFERKDQTLGRVLLAAREKKNHLLNALHFSYLEKLLTEKYGPPTFKNDSPRLDGQHLVSWNLGKTKVELQHTYIPDVMSSLGVMYEPVTRAKEAASDL